MNHIIMHTGAFCEILVQTLMAPFVVNYSQVGGLCDCKAVYGHTSSMTGSSLKQSWPSTQVVESKNQREVLSRTLKGWQ